MSSCSGTWSCERAQADVRSQPALFFKRESFHADRIDADIPKYSMELVSERRERAIGEGVAHAFQRPRTLAIFGARTFTRPAPLTLDTLPRLTGGSALGTTEEGASCQTDQKCLAILIPFRGRRRRGERRVHARGNRDSRP